MVAFARKHDVNGYTWDVRNRLSEVTTRATAGGAATSIVDYLYDAENRWIGENVDSTGDGQIDQEIRFAYDGDQIVLEPAMYSLLPLRCRIAAILVKQSN